MKDTKFNLRVLQLFLVVLWFGKINSNVVLIVKLCNWNNILCMAMLLIWCLRYIYINIVDNKLDRDD